MLSLLYRSEPLKPLNHISRIRKQLNNNKSAITSYLDGCDQKIQDPVPVSVLTQSGPDFLGLDQNCIQVQITGCHKEITQRLILINVECIYS